MSQSGRLAGIYLFEDQASAKSFLEGSLAAQVTGHPALSDFSVKQFDVMEALTEITHGPVKVLVGGQG